MAERALRLSAKHGVHLLAVNREMHRMRRTSAQLAFVHYKRYAKVTRREKSITAIRPNAAKQVQSIAIFKNIASTKICLGLFEIR